MELISMKLINLRKKQDLEDQDSPALILHFDLGARAIMALSTVLYCSTEACQTSPAWLRVLWAVLCHKR